MSAQPTGTVTLLFTDVEGSTRALQRLGQDRYAEAIALQRRLLREAFERHGGYEVDCEGDSFFVAFAELGEHRLKDLSAPQRIYELGDADFPPLASLHQTNLPIPSTPFLGRVQELAEVVRAPLGRGRPPAHADRAWRLCARRSAAPTRPRSPR